MTVFARFRFGGSPGRGTSLMFFCHSVARWRSSHIWSSLRRGTRSNGSSRQHVLCALFRARIALDRIRLFATPPKRLVLCSENCVTRSVLTALVLPGTRPTKPELEIIDFVARLPVLALCVVDCRLACVVRGARFYESWPCDRRAACWLCPGRVPQCRGSSATAPFSVHVGAVYEMCAWYLGACRRRV